MQKFILSEKEKKLADSCKKMISWLEENKKKFPPSFELGPGERVTDSAKCISTAISALQNYFDNKNFGISFLSAYNLSYRLKQSLKKN